MPIKILFFLLCFFVSSIGIGQTYVQWPISTQKLTGNYGELRPNHFHVGLDFSDETKMNQSVFAVKSGYVSRIKVSPYGYGKVLYVSHYDGMLSVYAHQSKFNDSIEAFVKREQLKNYSYEIELFPSKNEIQINQGDIIGYMGNTGGSTGPHLHFELRDVVTEIPLNPLRIYTLQDTIKPVCNAIAIFDLSDSLRSQIYKTVKVKMKRDSIFPENDSIVLNKSILGFGFSGFDKETFDGNPNNIYEAKLFYDKELIYHHQLNYIAFDFANFINEFSIEINRQKFQKCFVPKIYPKDLYRVIRNKGILELKDTLFHLLRFEFTDEAGSMNFLQIYVKTQQFSNYKWYNPESVNYFDCTRATSHSAKTFTIEMQPNSVYNNGLINVVDEFDSKGKVSVLVSGTHMRIPGKIIFKINNKLLKNGSKLVIRNNNSVYVPKTNGNNGECSFKSLGTIELLTDTTAPKIKTQITLKKLKKNIGTANHISFYVNDNLSGVGKYNLFLNNNWVIAEYDAKANLITYFFDNETPLGEIKFLLTVQDKVGNTGVFKLNLKR